MIAGIVSANLEPIIRISVLDSRGQTHERDAILDTGFNGWLCMPAEFIAMLGLNWQRVGTAILADGSQTVFDVYEGTVLWDNQPLTVPVDEAASEPLVGMSLMRGYELQLTVVEDGMLALTKASSEKTHQ